MAESRILQLVLKLQDNASKGLDSLNKSLEKNQEGLQAIAGAGAVVTGAVGFLVSKSVSEFSKLNESINAVQVVFGSAGKEVLEFGKISAKSVGLANSEFNQLSVGIGGLLKNAGVPMDKLAEKTIELTKRASDMASVNNTSVAEALSAIEQGLRGETEAMRKYTSDVTDASIQQYALSKGINKSVTEMTYQEKTLLRMEKIMADTNVTTGDFLNTQDSLANKNRILSAQWKDTLALLGTGFAPILQKIQAVFQPFLEKIATFITENPKLTTGIILVVGALGLLATVIGTIGLVLPAVISGFGLVFSATGGIVIAVIGAIVGAGYLLYQAWTNNWGGMQDKVNAFGGWIMSVYNTYLVPFYLKFKEFLTLTSGFWTFIWEVIKGQFQVIWSSIGAILGVAWSLITGIFKVQWQIFYGLFSTFVELLKGNWKGAWESFAGIFTGIWETIKSTFKSSLNYIISGLNNIISVANKVKIPEWAGGDGQAMLNIPTIPALANGGIATKPTLAMVGDGGENEAIVPLSKYNEMGFGGKGGGNTYNITINGGIYETKEKLKEMFNEILRKSNNFA